MAVTKHVPAEPAVNEVPERVQLDAVPRDTAKVTSPSPVPPEVVSVSAEPNVPLIDETVRVD